MRDKLKKSLREGLLIESMDLYIDNYESPDVMLETILDMCHFLLYKVSGDVIKNGDFPEGVKVYHGDIAPDGSDFDQETGTINFYVTNIDIKSIKKILSYIYYILPEYDVQLGQPRWEKYSEEDKEYMGEHEYRVIRIPVIENGFEVGDVPPELNLANGNANFIFGEVLEYEPDQYGLFFDLTIPELLMKINTARKKIPTMNLKGGWDIKGRIHRQLPDEDYVLRVLDRIEEIALWARERGFTVLSMR